jgi:ubiquinone/menaquinone biosynthesis C-methylase UbiE
MCHRTRRYRVGVASGRAARRRVGDTAAAIVGSTGTVAGCDLNADMLAEAARHVPAECCIEWRLGDAEALPFEADTFDVLFCQQGLQFFPNRATAVREMWRVLRPGGTAVVALWRSLEHNPIQRTERDCIVRHVAPEAGALWATASNPELDDSATLRALVTQNGFAQADVEPVELVIPAADPRAP